jgi:hypothetical protein
MNETTNIPHDPNAEECLIGVMFLSYETALQAIDLTQADAFYSSRHSRTFSAIRNLIMNGIVPDPITVASELGDPALSNDFITLMANSPGRSNIDGWVKIINTHYASRRLLMQLSASSNAVMSGVNPYETATTVEKFISSLGSAHNAEPEALTIDELSEQAEDLAPVVIPGMMNQDYRTIIVAEEGAGKSLLLRTIAMSASQGIHPFSHRNIKPIRALVIDLENPAQAILQTAVPFMNFVQSRSEDYDPERFKVFRRPGGIEIRRLSDKAEIQREIASHKPDLVCIGPIYKMYRRGANESYEDSADEAMAVLDDLRTKYGFALIMEHHAAKGKAGERRDLSPMGSQRWMAWPEVGISLYKDQDDPTMMHVKRYRGDRLTGVDWPDRIVRDRNWLIDGAWDGPVGI